MKAGCFILFFISGLFLLTLSCAMRENPFDPVSPYHHAPELSVELQFDSTQGAYLSPDTIRAIGPFTITIHAASNKFFGPSDTLPVDLWHFNNGFTISYKQGFKNDTTITLTQDGRHHLMFSTYDASNGTTAKRDIQVDVKMKKPPYFVSFTADRKRLLLNPPDDNRGMVTLWAVIADSNLLVDSIVVYIPFLDPISREDTSYIDTFEIDSNYIDTFEVRVNFSGSFGFSGQDSIRVPVTAVLFEKLGRNDTITTNITFANSGLPPRIDSVYIVDAKIRYDTIIKPNSKTGEIDTLIDTVPILFANKSICFGIDATDPDAKSTPRDSSHMIYNWNFGDTYLKGNEKLWQACHIYFQPGKYTVTATVTDDSGSISSKSIVIEVDTFPVTKPRFTKFSIEYKTTVAPCSVYISAKATDVDGEISYLLIMISKDNIIIPDWPEVTDWPCALPDPGTYNLHVFAFDDNGNSCDTMQTIMVTAPNENSSP